MVVAHEATIMAREWSSLLLRLLELTDATIVVVEYASLNLCESNHPVNVSRTSIYDYTHQ